MNFDKKVRSRIRIVVASDLPRMGGRCKENMQPLPCFLWLAEGGQTVLQCVHHEGVHCLQFSPNRDCFFEKK